MAPFGPLYFHQRAPRRGYRCSFETAGYSGSCYWHYRGSVLLLASPLLAVGVLGALPDARVSIVQ